MLVYLGLLILFSLITLGVIKCLEFCKGSKLYISDEFGTLLLVWIVILSFLISVFMNAANFQKAAPILEKRENISITDKTLSGKTVVVGDENLLITQYKETPWYYWPFNQHVRTYVQIKAD